MGKTFKDNRYGDNNFRREANRRKERGEKADNRRKFYEKDQENGR